MYLMAASGMAMLGTIGTILKVAVGLGFVIFVHELGHFLAAKACGVKCEKFYIGFDVPIKIGPLQLPRTLGKFRWGETEYGIGILPLGGYVKMLGQDDDPRRAVEEAERIKQGGDEGQEFKLDPRSYPAKSVPQRLVIISAGVLMNLLFAVIFAGTAYRAGVNYVPCEVSWAVPGSAAWSAGFEPGDRIVQIGRNSHRNEHLRHDWDLRQSIGTHGDYEDLDFLVLRADHSEAWITVRPFAAKINGKKQLPAIGVRPAFTTLLGGYRRPGATFPADDEQDEKQAQQSDPALPQKGDKVVAIDGTPIARFNDMRDALLRNVDRTLQLTVERTETGTKGDPPRTAQVSLVLEPIQRRRLGIITAFGPIAAVRRGSPAETAGLQVGDQLVAVAGQNVVDLVALSDRLRQLVGQQIEVTVKRGGASEPVVVQLTPTAPVSLSDSPQPGAMAGIEGLGITVPGARTIAAVIPGSEAESSGIRPGDKLIKAQLVSTDPKQTRRLLNDGKEFAIEDEGMNWTFLDAQTDYLEDDMRVVIKIERGTELKSFELGPTKVDSYLALRGLDLDLKEETRVAETWGIALSLGARQTFEDATRVVSMLKKLVTGRVSLTNLGGPGSIAAIAGIEAGKGWTSLLMFLTLLSANLAVLNFMPIPALDGGHIVFLVYEGVMGKPVNERIQMALTMAGVVCLIGLMIVVSGLDVWRLFEWFG